MKSFFGRFSNWKLLLFTITVFLCFHYSGAANNPIDTPPADVADFTAHPQGDQIVLSWMNPDDGDFAGTMIRYRTDGKYPLNRHDGTFVCSRKNRPGSIDKYILTVASGKTAYYFSAFTYDDAGNFSHTAHVSAIPSTNPASPSRAVNGTPQTAANDNGGGGGGGCFIATAAYGSKMEKHVRVLTAFRDRYLLTNRLGNKIVNFYYKSSPPIADYLKDHLTARRLVRCILAPVTVFAYLSLHAHPGFVFSAVVFLMALLGYGIKSGFAFLLPTHRQ